MNSVNTGGGDPGLLIRYAEGTQLQASKEDKASARSSKETSFKEQIDAGKDAIDQQRRSASKKLRASGKKTKGTLSGFSIGAVIMIVIACVACCTPGGQAIAGFLLPLALAMFGAGAGVGGALGSAAGKKDEKAAASAQAASDRFRLSEKEAEKEMEAWSDNQKSADGLHDQVLEDQRQQLRDQTQGESRLRG